MAVILHHEAAEAAVAGGKMTLQQARQLAGALDPLDWPELLRLRHHVQLVVEACIWARLYSSQLRRWARTDWSLGEMINVMGKSRWAGRTGIPVKLLDYWRTRFGPLIDAWQREAGAANGQAVGLPFAQRDAPDQELLVIIYLSQVERKVDEAIAEVVRAGP